MKNYFTLLFCIILLVPMYSQTSLQGSLTDAKTDEALLFANVAVYKNDALITGTQTNFGGDYYFGDLEPGTYDLVFSYVGYEKVIVSDLELVEDKGNTLNEILSAGVSLPEVVITGNGSSRNCILTCEYILPLPRNEQIEFRDKIEHPKSLIYPNPTSSYFTIKSELEIKDASIFNLSGQLVKRLNKGQIQVDVNDLIPGTYFLVIVDGSRVQTEKVVVL